MKIKINILFILLTLAGAVYSQWDYTNIPSQSGANYNYFSDPVFIDGAIGYYAIPYVVSGTTNVIKLYKTSNFGINWSLISTIDNSFYIEKSPSIYFINELIGYCALLHKTYGNYAAIKILKTTNGGNNWISVWTEDMININGTPCIPQLIFINANTGYLQLNKCLYKTTNGGNNWNLKLDCQLSGIILCDIEISKLNNNIVFIGGTSGADPKLPYLIKSTDGFENSQTTLYDGTTYEELGGINGMSLIINDYNNEILKIGSHVYYKDEYFNYIDFMKTWEIDMSNNYTPLSEFQLNHYNISNVIFQDYTFGYIQLSRSASYPKYLFSTSDGGHSWSSPEEFSTYGEYGFFTKANDIVCLALYDNSIPNFSSPLFLLSRKLNLNFVAISDYQNATQGSKMTFYSIPQTYPLPLYNTLIKGGEQHVKVFLDPPTESTIFYRWADWSKDYDNLYYRISYKRDTVFFKSKNISTTVNAISNISNSTKTSPPTRIIRDTATTTSPGIIHQIHESMGGIFYSRSTNNGSNFSKEEVVDHFGGTKEPFENKNSFLNIKRRTDNSPVLEQDRNVAACWERYNNSTNETEICLAQRILDVGPPYNYYEWLRYTLSGSNLPVFKSFSSPPNFNSYPKVFIIAPIDLQDNWNVKYIFVPHLRPGTNGNDLWITARFGDQFLEYVVDYNVSDVSVSAPYNAYMGFNLHFAYKKDRNIVYRKECIYYSLSSFQHYPVEINPNVSEGDGQQSRYAPDISLRNGGPVIAWQGSSLRTRTILFENGNEEKMVSNYFPIFARYKSTNTGEGWSTLIKYDSPPNITQQNANVEGSKNKNAFLINYSVDNRFFKQDVKFQDPNYSKYRCCPSIFEGTDAKLVRGSFIDDFGQNSNPMLLTLQPQSPTLYGVSKQPFSITNIPCNAVSDNYTNLEGKLRDRNINYSFNLGPIIVKNTVVSPNAGLSSPIDITVQNIVDFSENMISKPFYLSNGDTLILAGTGNYILNPNGTFANKKFNVSLFKNSTNEIQQLLFRDTIKTEDSIQSEYLRGFIINNIHGGSDSFYVKIIIDSSNISDAAYSYCGVYSPDEVSGDNFTNYKSKVHFENQSYQNINDIPKTFELSQNYPNPFNPSTTIKYALPKNEFVTIKVYDITGREILRLVSEYKQAGYHSVNFNGVNLASGVYFYRIQVGDFMSVKRMLLIK
jgi:hypothetical protein